MKILNELGSCIGMIPRKDATTAKAKEKNNMTKESNVLTLQTLLGDYPNTLALKKGDVRSPGLAFDFADAKVPNTAFKDVVRHLKYDVAELAIVTYLQAKAYGKRLVLLPAVVGAVAHPFLVYNAERGRITPADLKGRHVAFFLIGQKRQQ
jgi:hypothetical protein